MILVWEKVVVLPALKLLACVCVHGPGKPWCPGTAVKSDLTSMKNDFFNAFRNLFINILLST